MIRPGGRVTRWEFEELAEGRIPQEDSNEQQAEPQSVLVTMPKQMPTPEMFNAIGKVAGSFSEIAGMYFGQVIYPDGEPHWTIAVEFAADPSSQTGQAHDGRSGGSSAACFPEKRYDRLAARIHRSGAIDQDNLAKNFIRRRGAVNQPLPAGRLNLTGMFKIEQPYPLLTGILTIEGNYGRSRATIGSGSHVLGPHRIGVSHWLHLITETA